MSTFDGVVKEFPQIRIDNFLHHGQRPLACFLSHVHSDHLRGLESLKSPFIYCSAATREILLRLEKYPHRMNFAKGILESRKQTYRHLKNLLKPIPLHTPTRIELSPTKSIRVTLFDANHCIGAVMFLIEGDGKAILYTGDVRSEVWWTDALVRNPFMIPYTLGDKRLDNVYLDTTFASTSAPYKDFPSKGDGIRELLSKVSKHPAGTVFYFNAWTFGYEEAWIALSAFVDSRIHLDAYRYRLYRSLGDSADCDISERAPLIGFQLGNHYHPGCITNSDNGVQIHSCERGTHCHVFQEKSIVRITPIVTRHNGVEYAEMGAGGGNGDLNQVHELEMDDVSALGSLMALCNDKLKDRPEMRQKVLDWLFQSAQQGGRNIKLDTATFFEALHEGDDAVNELDEIPLDRLVLALEKLTKPKAETEAPPECSIVRLPEYCSELRYLVTALRPRALYPNTEEPGMDVGALFGDLLGEQAALPSSASDANDAAETRPTTRPTDSGKRKAPPSAIEESLSRRQRAYNAALGLDGEEWGRSISLTSIAGYHNEGSEEEL